MQVYFCVLTRFVTIYHDLNTYGYHTVYICLSMVFAVSHLRLDDNFPLNCSLGPPTRAAETEAFISNLYPTSKYKLRLLAWEYFGYRKDERLFVLEDRHS